MYELEYLINKTEEKYYPELKERYENSVKGVILNDRGIDDTSLKVQEEDVREQNLSDTIIEASVDIDSLALRIAELEPFVPIKVQDIALSTYPSNYNPNMNETNYTDTMEGAVKTRVRFDVFGTEPDYDFVRIKDSLGNTIQTLHGSYTVPFYSEWVYSDYVTINFTSDSSIQTTGYHIDQVEASKEVI